MNIDTEKLREHLLELYNAAAFGGFPAAIAAIGDIETASEAELIQLARAECIDLDDFLLDD